MPYFIPPFLTYLSHLQQPKMASLVAQLVKNPPATWETWVRSLGWEDPLEKANHTPVYWPGVQSRTQLNEFQLSF